MARRQSSVLDLLILAPWWVSLLLAPVTYFALPHLGSTLPEDSVAYKLGSGLGAQVAPIVAGALVFVSLLSLIRSLRNRSMLARQTGLDSLRELPWKRFEDLMAEVYRRQGYAVRENLGSGADGGIDLVLTKGAEKILVQCKRWKGKAVGAPIVRELYGLMVAENATEAHLVATTAITNEAAAFARGKPIRLINGDALLEMVRSAQDPLASVPPPLPHSDPSADERLPEEPSCPSCGAEMVLRSARRGSRAGEQFWGCSTYPKCRGTRSWG